jgi:hypothetical protein
MTVVESLAVIQSLVDRLRSFHRPDPRTYRLYTDHHEDVMRVVYALKPSLDPDTARELMELWNCYTDVPHSAFEPSSILQESDLRGPRREYIEDVIQAMLDDMVRVASPAT